MEKPLILIIEDDEAVRLAARFVLEDRGYQVVEVDHPHRAIELVSDQPIDLILLDMNFDGDTTSGDDGLECLNRLRAQWADLPIIAMTAWSSTALVAKALQAGANDFLEKPWDNQRLYQVLQQQLFLRDLKRKNLALQQQLENPDAELIWQSSVMSGLMAKLSAVAVTDANILLTGENGTGKSQLAHWIHRHSSRSAATFLSINMGAVPDALFESEMFGHKRGAFTDARENRIGRFEIAKDGTLFLDEIASVPLTQQVKLLRVLESGEFEPVGSNKTQRTNVRIISASNCDFTQLIDEGAFRKDLYYRLNTLEFRVPALRERPDDIVPLANFFIQKHCLRYRKPGLSFSDCAISALLSYSWPGNIRELSHVMERAVLMSQLPMLTAAALSLRPEHQVTAEKIPLITLEAAELQLIHQALRLSDGNKQKAAEILGISKQALYRRLEKYDLEN